MDSRAIGNTYGRRDAGDCEFRQLNRRPQFARHHLPCFQTLYSERATGLAVSVFLARAAGDRAANSFA